LPASNRARAVEILSSAVAKLPARNVPVTASKKSVRQIERFRVVESHRKRCAVTDRRRVISQVVLSLDDSTISRYRAARDASRQATWRGSTICGPVAALFGNLLADFLGRAGISTSVRAVGGMCYLIRRNGRDGVRPGISCGVDVIHG
jgi:hypothetical protein